MLEIQEEFPLEDWIQELAVLMKHVEGIKKREAHERIIENITEFVGYHQVGMTPKMAFEKFWGGDK